MNNFWQKLNKPFTVLAPMYDVTDFVFREIIAETAKPDVMFTEFTCADAFFTKGHDKALTLLKFSNNQKPIVAQIWGSNPDNFYKASQCVQELGFDGIDINMGYPDKDVIKNKSGAALIGNYDLAEKLIEAAKKGAPKIPLSVKTRLAKTSEDTEKWISFLLKSGVQAIILHGRTAKSPSKIPANWGEINKAVKLRDNSKPKVLIVGNGGVQGYSEVLDRHKSYGIDGVMIGTGVFLNPWIFNKDDISTSKAKQDYVELMIKHTKLFYETWGDSKNFEIMKKFFKMYINNFRGAGTLRNKLMEVKNYQDFKKLVTRLRILPENKI